MKCAYCGAEIKVGCLYCSVCGHEAQVVSDSGLLEDELLRQLLKNEDEPKKTEMPEEKKNTPKKSQKNKKKNYTPLIVTLCILGVLLLATITLVVVRNNQQRNSYEYQVQKAEAYTAEKNYAKAINYYKKAIELKQDDIDSRIEMAKLYRLMEDEISAVNTLNEIISLDEDNADAYQLLIEGYAKKNDYESILKLKDTVTDKKLLELFDEYGVVSPKLSIKPGTYAKYITIELTAESGCRIYYTLDGSDPTTKGELYDDDDPITMEEQGTLELKAVCCNEYGIYSEVVGGTYVVELQKPPMVRAFPENGTIYIETTIMLTGSENCRIYYTWDGTDPTTESPEYTEPIKVPEGNNILSAIQVDEYGMVSDVLRCNYVYKP